MPSSDRNIREQLKNLPLRIQNLPEKRQGTKGTEYHISLLPTTTKTGDQVLVLPKKKSLQSYCREELWSRWNKTNHAAQTKVQFALRTVQAVFALQRNDIKLMDAYDVRHLS